MPKVLVTGCSGFVGRILIDKMSAQGFDVFGVDRTPIDPDFKGEQQLTVDLMEETSVKDMLAQIRPEQIVHLAAQSSVHASFDKPIETILNNTLPILYILDYLKGAKGLCRLLAIGSADEYGPVTSEDRLPLREDSSINPVNPYALGKSIQNQYCGGYATLYGLDVVVTRSFNHTGAGQRDTFVLPSFARQIVEIKRGSHEPVIKVGDLDVKRDFLDVADVCDAYVALLDRGHKGETYNVCSGRSYRIRDLLDQMCEMAGIKVEIKIDESRLRPVDTRELRGDAGKLMDHTGWKPSVSIDRTLRSLLDYWERELR